MHQPAEGRRFAAILFTLLTGIALSLGGGPLRAAPEGSPWGAGYFPNVPLQTQDGSTVRFYDDLIKDKVFAINLIFTHCTDTCPAETANLRQVEKLLGDRVGKDIFFYSISIDPKRDTPASLKAYARKFKAGPGWTFLTGNPKDVTLIRRKLGMYRDDAEGRKLAGHSTHFIVGNDRTGQWIKRSPFDEPKTLAHLLGSRLPNVQAERPDRVSYAQAPQLANPGQGEKLFRSRCDSCHSLGEEEGIGPGLAGVTHNRDRAWLSRWLKSPDRMIEEKDPLALALYQRYQRVAMPNLRLSDADVNALIDYMERSAQAVVR
jgi:protein SCO1/2